MNRFKQFLLVALGVCSIGVAMPVLLPSYVHAGPPTSVQVCPSGGKCDSFIVKYVNPFVTLLTIVIGVVAAISIVVAGIQYASAGSDPSKVQKAKDRIGQTLLGLVAYLLLFSFLNFLVPGGLF